jgi:dienelactone hydrolase
MLMMTACNNNNIDAGETVDAAARGADAKAELTAASETVIIGAKDGKKFVADHVPVPHARAIIVLFHQAGSSAYEYSTIAPRLNALGFSTLAVDQRSGGNLFGPNRTVARAGKSQQDYLAALPDLEAALNWARLQNSHVILWGSSYSASLIFRIAADNPDLVTALLAFSPGEYFPDKHFTSDAASDVHVPVFITCAKDAEEVSEARAIFDGMPDAKKTLFLPKIGGIHGSSTLRQDRNAAGASENWEAVTAFLGQLHLPPS